MRVTRPHSIGDVAGKVTICFNEQRKKDTRESRYDELDFAQEQIKKGKAVKPGIEKYFGKNGRLLIKRVKEDEKYDGFSCIFTTATVRPSELVRLYFDKDIVEKAFQSLKGIIRVQPVRHWLYNRVTAHVFICYLSYLLLSLLKFRLSKISMSPVVALRELDTMYKVYIRDRKKRFQLSRTVTLSKSQENILKTIDKSLLTKCSG